MPNFNEYDRPITQLVEAVTTSTWKSWAAGCVSVSSSLETKYKIGIHSAFKLVATTRMLTAVATQPLALYMGKNAKILEMKARSPPVVVRVKTLVEISSIETIYS
jgi:hypothetical protein